ncbi:MAG: DNA recombination protein RmuC [Propionibacteriales bacterium]|nr:DNA recombination protein RmuC [Propionibacteriales bacterium]
MVSIVALLIGLLLGVGVGWVLRQARQQAELADVTVRHEREVGALRHEVELAHSRNDVIVAEIREQDAAARAAVESDLAGALATVEALQAALEAAREQHQATIDQQRLTQREREQAEGGHTQVLKTLTPVAEQLRAMQRRVEELEQQRSHQHGELSEQLRSTQVTVAESKKAADTLASALKDNAVRGVWGETQLRTLVESAGLLPRVDFDTQHSIEADSGARRPDMVINLPGGKQMAIDAKVPYSAYIDAHGPQVGATDRQRLLVEHARKVRGHVDTLSAKSYWTGLTASPEFTVAFIPNEQLLAVALETDPSLLEYSFGKGVLLATPTNLWAILKTVAFTWRQDVLTDDAKQLFDLGRELYRRISTLAEHADKLRRSLETTVKSYNSFANSLESRVLVTARKLDNMDESAVLGAARQIDIAPRALTSGEFAVIADLERPELTFDFDAVDAVEADVIDEEDRAG